MTFALESEPMKECGRTASQSGFCHDRNLDLSKTEWLTPPKLIAALGGFDLDPCATIPSLRPWDTAVKHYSIEDNGLLKPWHGRVWCNPPYGDEMPQWLARCVDHRNVIALIFARTETKQFFEYIWPKATAVCFIKGRLRFWELTCSLCGLGLSHESHVKGQKFQHESIPQNVAVQGGTAGAPSMLVTWDDDNGNLLRHAVQHGRIAGCYIDLRGGRTAP